MEIMDESKITIGTYFIAHELCSFYRRQEKSIFSMNYIILAKMFLHEKCYYLLKIKFFYLHYPISWTICDIHISLIFNKTNLIFANNIIQSPYTYHIIFRYKYFGSTYSFEIGVA